MRISINPITVDEVPCAEANVYVAVSESAAIRVVPVDSDGAEQPDGAVGIVGNNSREDVAIFIGAVTDAVKVLLEGRGI